MELENRFIVGKERGGCGYKKVARDILVMELYFDYGSGLKILDK